MAGEKGEVMKNKTKLFPGVSMLTSSDKSEYFINIISLVPSDGEYLSYIRLERLF